MPASVFTARFFISFVLVALSLPALINTANRVTPPPLVKLQKSVLLCPLYPSSYQECQEDAPSLFEESSYYQTPVLTDAGRTMLEKKLASPSKRKEAFKSIDAKFKKLEKSDNPFLNLTLTVELQEVFMKSSASRPRTPPSATPGDPKKQWISAVLAVLKDMVTCYEGVGSKATATECAMETLLALHVFLDHTLVPFLEGTLGVTAHHPLSQMLAQNTLVQRGMVLDMGLQTLLRQISGGFDVQTLANAVNFPEAFHTLAQPSRPQEFEATLRCVQSLQRMGAWILAKKKDSPFQFMILKAGMSSFLTPHLEKLISLAYEPREDL